MLRTSTALGLLLLAGATQAAPPRDRLRLPERLTIGAADQFLGALSPDGKRLFFVSSSNATLQIFSQNMEGGPATQLFDERADCTAPAVSPDGKHLAYLSFHDDATGDVCVRDLATLKRRCLTDSSTAEQSVLWEGIDRLLALTRQGLHEDPELDRLALGGGSRQALLFRNMASPALSHDGRWLAYVPTERESEDIGASFAARAVGSLAFQRLDRLRERPTELKVDLPGASGFPSFSADGRWLYFAQYLDDTNLDGTIDARDRSTLFRVRFDAKAVHPVSDAERAHPEQLTSVTWNCQYPAPGPASVDRLIATCSLTSSLDVYSLPLEGAIPSDWSVDKLREELAATTDRGERLLLSARLLASKLPPTEETALLEDVLRLHLERGALESASFTLGRLRHAGRSEAAVLDLLEELIAHRRAERALDRGQLSTAFITEARERLARIAARPATGEAGALKALIRCEILDVLADKKAAVEALRSIDLAQVKSPFVLQLIATRGAELYTQLDRRAALLELQRDLAAHPELDERARLAFAERYVETLLRGAPESLRPVLIDDALRHLPPGGDVATRVKLERLLLDLKPDISDADLDYLRGATFALYRQADSFERRRMIVHATVTRAAAIDSDKILYDFANAWVSLMKRGTAERRYAERLYRDVVLERAYIDLRNRRLSDARGRFYGVTLQTDSLEAWTGFLELRSTEDVQKAVAELEQRVGKDADNPVLRYGRAYLAVRQIEKITDRAAKLAKLDEAIGHLKVAARSLARSAELNFLWGYCLYVHYLATGDRAYAQEATTKLLLAMDLSSDNPRYYAIAGELAGRVQSTVGNQRIALDHLETRDQLPFADKAGALGHLITEAHALQLVDREDEAVEQIEQAVELSAQPGLERFRPVVLDRAALHHLAAGEPDKAVARYDELLRLLPKAKVTDEERARNRFTALLGRGASLLSANRPKDAARDLAEAAALIERDPKVAKAPSLLPTSLPPDRDPVRTYQALLAGLRAEAYRRIDQLEPARQQQTLRRDLLKSRYKDRKADEDLYALGESEAHLGELAVKRGDLGEAAKRYEAALEAADAYSQKTGSEIHPLRLRAIDDLAIVRTRMHGDERAKAKLEQKIGALLDVLAKRANPAWAGAKKQLEQDLTTLALERNHRAPR